MAIDPRIVTISKHLLSRLHLAHSSFVFVVFVHPCRPELESLPALTS
jgi:hypothetical protein